MTFKSTELQILEEVVDRALAKGWRIDVNDGEETTVKDSRDRAAILEACQSTDWDYLTFWDATAPTRIGWVWLIYGNGTDLISDHSASKDMDEFVNPILDDINKAFG